MARKSTPTTKPVDRSRDPAHSAPGLTQTMNRHLGQGAPGLAQEMTRVSNDPQFRQNPDATQHATIEAMGKQGAQADFRKMVGDTARSKAFGGMSDARQLALMEQLGGADAQTRKDFEKLWKSDGFSQAGLPAQVAQLQGFGQPAREEDPIPPGVGGAIRMTRGVGQALQGAGDPPRPPADGGPQARRAAPTDPTNPTNPTESNAPRSDAARAPADAQGEAAPRTGKKTKELPKTDLDGRRYPMNADGTRYAMPTDPTQATPRQFMENHVLPTLRQAKLPNGEPMYPRSVQQVEQLLGRMQHAQDQGWGPIRNEQGLTHKFGTNPVIGQRSVANAWKDIQKTGAQGDELLKAARQAGFEEAGYRIGQGGASYEGRPGGTYTTPEKWHVDRPEGMPKNAYEAFVEGVNQRHTQGVNEARRGASRLGFETKWQDTAASYSQGQFGTNGEHRGVVDAIDVRRVHEWNAIQDAMKTGRMSTAEGMAHLHETAGRFMGTMSHEYAHRVVEQGRQRVFDPTLSREENVRRLHDHALQDEASRVRNGYRTERVFAEESTRAGGHRYRQNHPFTQEAQDAWRQGRMTAQEAQQSVIDRVANKQPSTAPEGVTYREQYRRGAEQAYDRLNGHHRRTPLTEAETARAQGMGQDLQRVSEVAKNDPQGALKQLEQLRGQGNWEGLQHRPTTNPVIGRSSMDDMWRDMQRFNVQGEDMARLGYMYGRDEASHRIDQGRALYEGRGGEVRTPERWHVERPQGMPQDVYDQVVRGVNDRHAEAALTAHQDAARGMVRRGLDTPVRMDLPDRGLNTLNDQVLRAHQQAPLTGPERTRLGRMSEDLAKAQKLVDQDPQAALRTLSQLRETGPWKGLNVETLARSHYPEQAVNRLWGEMQELQKANPGMSMDDIGDQLGRAEYADRLGPNWYQGRNGNVSIPGDVAFHGRPQDMPQSAYDSLLRGMNAQHAQQAVDAYQRAGQGMVRTGAQLDLPSDGTASRGALDPAKQPKLALTPEAEVAQRAHALTNRNPRPAAGDAPEAGGAGGRGPDEPRGPAGPADPGEPGRGAGEPDEPARGRGQERPANADPEAVRRGQAAVDGVVQHKLNEAYEKGPQELRRLRDQLDPKHRRMLDDMLTEFDGNADKLMNQLQRGNENLDPKKAHKNLEGFAKRQETARTRAREQAELAQRRADEVRKFGTTEEYVKQARKGIEQADDFIKQVQAAPDFEGKNALLKKLRGEREALDALVDPQRGLGGITDKNVTGSLNNVRGYGEEWNDVQRRLADNHRVQWGGGADVVDHTTKEAIQHKASNATDANLLKDDLRKANAQFSGIHGERPPEGYKNIINMTIGENSPLHSAEPGSAAHRQKLLDAAADALDGDKLHFGEMNFRYPGPDGKPVDVNIPRAEIEAHIRARGGQPDKPKQPGDQPEGRKPNEQPGRPQDQQELQRQRPDADGPNDPRRPGGPDAPGGPDKPDGGPRTNPDAGEPRAPVNPEPPEVAPRPGDNLHPDVRGAVDDDLVGKMSQDDVRRLNGLTQNPALRQDVSGLLKNAKTPEEARRIMGALENVPEATRGAMAKTLGELSGPDLNRFLGGTIGDRPAAEVLGKVMQNLPAQSQEAMGRLMKTFGPEHASDFLKLAQHVDGKMLKTTMDTLDTAMRNLDPKLVGEAGKLFGAMDNVISEMGIPLTKKVAGRALRGIGAMLPVAGTAFAGYDMVRMGRVAADGSLPPELRYLGGVGVALNGLDAGLGIAEMIPGVAGVGLPANLALGASALGLDLYTHHLVDQYKANPGDWKASRGLNAFIAGTSLAMGPTGAAMLVGTFGPTGAQEKMLDLGEVGGEAAIKAARMGGVISADATGRGMKFTAQGIDALADVIRNPEKFGKEFGLAMHRMGVGAQKLGRNAITALNQAAGYAGELGQRAVHKLGQAGDWLASRGQEGLQTLQWMFNNPGEASKIAQQKIHGIIQAGGALGRQAWDGLMNAGERGLQAARHAVDAMGRAGQRGLDMLNYAMQNPGQAAGQVRDWAVNGIQNLAQKGGELGRRAVNNLIDFVNAQPQMAERAVGALRDLARQGGDALQEIGRAWGKNLTEGGRAVMASLENLGDAGVEALGRLGRYGGQLAVQSAQSLGRMFNSGVDAARAGLQQVAQTLSPENLQRFLLDQPAKAARAVFDALGGQRISQVVQGLQNAPAQLRKLWDQMSWGNVRSAFNNMGRDVANGLLNALDPSRLRGMLQHFDGGFLRNIWDSTKTWGSARRIFEAAGGALKSKLMGALGGDRMAALINSAGTGVDWVRKNLQGAFGGARQLANTLRHATTAGLGKLRDALGVDRLASNLRWMRDQGIEYGGRLVSAANALGDRALKSAMGIVDYVAPKNNMGYRALPRDTVPPWDPRAQWWFGMGNPFR